MKVFSRAIDEGITLEAPDGGQIVVVVRRIVGSRSVQLEIDAPDNVPIHRGEVWAAISRMDGVSDSNR